MNTQIGIPTLGTQRERTAHDIVSSAMKERFATYKEHGDSGVTSSDVKITADDRWLTAYKRKIDALRQGILDLTSCSSAEDLRIFKSCLVSAAANEADLLVSASWRRQSDNVQVCYIQLTDHTVKIIVKFTYGWEQPNVKVTLQSGGEDLASWEFVTGFKELVL